MKTFCVLVPHWFGLGFIGPSCCKSNTKIVSTETDVDMYLSVVRKNAFTHDTRTTAEIMKMEDCF
jgi:hypothetical protein